MDEADEKRLAIHRKGLTLRWRERLDGGDLRMATT